MANHARINIRTIMTEFNLSFKDVMIIVRDENWKTIGKRGTFFKKQVVYDYFAARGIRPQTINFRQIMAEYGLTKGAVFQLFRDNKWRPVSKGKGTGALWAYDRATIEEYFASPAAEQYKSNAANK